MYLQHLSPPSSSSSRNAYARHRSYQPKRCLPRFIVRSDDTSSIFVVRRDLSADAGILTAHFSIAQLPGYGGVDIVDVGFYGDTDLLVLARLEATSVLLAFALPHLPFSAQASEMQQIAPTRATEFEPGFRASSIAVNTNKQTVGSRSSGWRQDCVPRYGHRRALRHSHARATMIVPCFGSADSHEPKLNTGRLHLTNTVVLNLVRQHPASIVLFVIASAGKLPIGLIRCSLGSQTVEWSRADILTSATITSEHGIDVKSSVEIVVRRIGCIASVLL
ncbi:hypothetical protein L1887_51867 [Cichorium endivia]|nr:hypothetical protein L1887_51867 [Cichorium endivia]